MHPEEAFARESKAMKLDRSKKRISKKTKNGFQGYPLVTIAYYGPGKSKATKVGVGVMSEDGGEIEMRKFFSEQDVRDDAEIQSSIVGIISQVNARSVSAVDSIIGCPHEEGIDYPEGEECQECEFWIGRDRFSGEYIN